MDNFIAQYVFRFQVQVRWPVHFVFLISQWIVLLCYSLWSWKCSCLVRDIWREYLCAEGQKENTVYLPFMHSEIHFCVFLRQVIEITSFMFPWRSFLLFFIENNCILEQENLNSAKDINVNYWNYLNVTSVLGMAGKGDYFFW